MNRTDNARYWNEYHNLKYIAYKKYKKQDKILGKKLNDGETDIDTYMSLHRIIYSDYENDPSLKEFSDRHNVKIPKWKFWQKEKYIKGPNEHMKCVICGFSICDIYHTQLGCSTDIINLEHDERMDEYDKAQKKRNLVTQ